MGLMLFYKEEKKLDIKVLGTGCKKCKALEQNVQIALKEMNIDVKVQKVEDIKEIMKFKVMSTPALVINNKVVSTGKLLSVTDIKKLLS
jgi:small redox-active disulfide protein 2